MLMPKQMMFFVSDVCFMTSSEEADRVLVKVKEFSTGLSNYIDGENQRLREEVSS